jgi:RimJ/RimL family protein N-acetyltransferase
VHPGGQETPEIKYALKRACWGKGLVNEIVRAVLDFAHDACAMPEVIATIYPANLASRRVAQKAGMALFEIRPLGAATSMQVYQSKKS